MIPSLCEVSFPSLQDMWMSSRERKSVGNAERHGFDVDLFIASSLIDMSAKCTPEWKIEDSYRVFSLLPWHDRISRNCIIAGCVQNGLFMKA